MISPDLLETGIFTVPEAADLVDASQKMVRAWLDGEKGKQFPIIENQLGRVGGKLVMSFTNLMEIQFIHFFVKAGVSLREVRAIMHEVRDTLEHPHPFATSTVFQTDGRKIVATIARKNGVNSIYDLKSRNYEMKDVVVNSLKADVIYDPEGNARIWYPRRKMSPNVVVNPKRSFGRPVLRDSSVPTSALAAAYVAEKSFRSVALMYEVPESQVKEAVEFQTSLRRAA